MVRISLPHPPRAVTDTISIFSSVTELYGTEGAPIPPNFVFDES